MTTLPADLAVVLDQLDAAEADARAIVSGLSETTGTWRERPDSWSVAECLDHLAVANTVYVDAMQPAADKARAAGRMRRGAARPSFIGRWFITMLEPPVSPRLKGKSPKKIEPRPSPALADAFAAFIASQVRVRTFLAKNADLDLTWVRFKNPFIGLVRFSLATGILVIPAHERRHLWQARRVRAAAAQAGHTS